MRSLSVIVPVTILAQALLAHPILVVADGLNATGSDAAIEASQSPSGRNEEARRDLGANDVGAVKLISGSQKSASAGDDVEAVVSVAERISRLQALIEADEKRLEALRTSLNAPENEYVKAAASFRELDELRMAQQQELAELEKAGAHDELAKRRTEAENLETKWSLAKERFDLAIGERKAMQESVATLQRKLDGERAVLLKLKSVDEPQPLGPSHASQPQATPAEPPINVQEQSLLPSPSVGGTPPTTAATTPPPTPNSPMLLAAEPQQPQAITGSVEETSGSNKRFAKELAIANEAAQKSLDEAMAAEHEARSIKDRFDALSADIALQRQLRSTARRAVDNSEKLLFSLNEDLFRKLAAGESIEEVRKQIAEASQRHHDNNLKTREINTRLDDLQSQLARLQAEKLAAVSLSAQKRDVAERARAVVEYLKNPFTARNVLQWLIDHAPRIVTILIALALFMWLSRTCEKRLVELTAKRGRRGSREERENRAKTLLGVFRNVANIVIVAGGVMMILDEVGVPVAPIVGGAAVFGLAVAFGAQSLIKDYFVGFMVLLEQQYLVNDVVAIGDIRGQVERVSLRITVLRDLEGRVHFVPHSQINTVTNLTHGWSRAVFEIGVAYKESVDRVIQVLSTLAEELRHDEKYRLLILSDPVMLGVDSFGSSAVVIKFYIPTRPLQQWTVKRELLRRIKNEFDRLGIEIPFPHVTLYHGTQRAEEQSDQEEAGRFSSRDVA